MSPNIPSRPGQDLPLRRRCRDPRCGAQLKKPTNNLHHAFCSPGCHAGYHRNRCIVCEAKLPPGPSNREICRRAECRAELRKYPQVYRWSGFGERPPRSAHSTGPKIGTKSDRPWRKIAGPDLPEINLRIGLDPEFAGRLDRVNAAHLEPLYKAKRRADRAAIFKRKTPPANLISGYKFPDAPVIDLSPTDDPPTITWAIVSRWEPTGAGATIEDLPIFLDRAAATRPAASEETDPMPGAGLAFRQVA